MNYTVFLSIGSIYWYMVTLFLIFGITFIIGTVLKDRRDYFKHYKK